MEQLYEMIFKRRSVRRYDGKRPLSEAELAEVKAQLERLQPLDADIPAVYIAGDPDGRSAQDQGYVIALCVPAPAGVIVFAHQ